MMKQFKAKKIKKGKRMTRFIFIFFFFFAYVFMTKYCLSNKLDKNVLSGDVNYVSPNISKIISSKITKTINEPVTLLNDNVKNAVKEEDKKTRAVSKKEEPVSKKEAPASDEVVDKVPLVYVYNTHQSEGYEGCSVYDAALTLSEKLNKSGINTYFEEQSVSAFLQTNNLKYYKSYEVSRRYLNEATSKYNTIKYFFDIHRDAVSKAKSTLNYKDKAYAKVLFIVGLDNPNYEANLKNTNRLNQIVERKIPGISRGVMQKGGKGVDGVYNQDVSENLFLIEIGSNNNTKEEVERTINVIYEAITEYIRGVV